MPGSRKHAVDFLMAGTGTQSGNVVEHDLTAFELGRLCIETMDRYPDLETWSQTLVRRGLIVKLHRYTERIGRQGLSGYLWLYYVSAKRSQQTRWHVWEDER